MTGPLGGHPCTAWCTATRHVDLVHAAPAWTPAEIVERVTADYRRLGVHVDVVAVEPAREAPPSPEPHAPWEPARPGWLVTWELVDGGGQ